MSDNRKKILDTALKLFTTKGYENTSVNQIISEIGIAKGTFYHYFKSKEEVMNEVISEIIDEDIKYSLEITNDDSLSGFEKAKKILISQQLNEKSSRGDIISEIHNLDDPFFHQRSQNEAILRFAPLLAQVVEQGNEEGSFNCKYPLETIEFLMGASNAILNERNLGWTIEELDKRMIAFVYMAETMLGTKPGELKFLISNHLHESYYSNKKSY